MTENFDEMEDWDGHDLQIETGIKAPSPKTRSDLVREALAKMNVGDSFLIEKAWRSHVMNIAKTYKPGVEALIKTQVVPVESGATTHCRVWFEGFEYLDS